MMIFHLLLLRQRIASLPNTSTSLSWRGRREVVGAAFEVGKVFSFGLGRGEEKPFSTTSFLSSHPTTRTNTMRQSKGAGRLLMKGETLPCSFFPLFWSQRRFFSVERKKGGEEEKRQYIKRPLTAHLREKYKINDNKLASIANHSLGFLDLPVDDFESLKKISDCCGLPLDVLLTYGYDDFKSFKEQMNRMKWLKERLGVSDEDLMKILFHKPFLFDQSKEDLEDKVNYLEKELGLTIKEIVVVFMRSIHDLRLGLSEWRKYTDFLKSHYGFNDSHLKRYFVRNSRHMSLLTDDILRNCVARKMIFEDLYGEGIFSKKTGVSNNCMTTPLLLTLSPERLVAVINALLKAANQNSLSDIKGLCHPNLLVFYAEVFPWRYALLSRYFRGSPYREPLRGEGWEYHLDAGRYEERQREIDMKYGIESCSQDDDLSWSEEPSSRINKEEEMKLFEDYQAYRQSDSLVGTENLYVRLKEESIKTLMKEGFPSFLRSVDPRFMDEFEDVLVSHDFSMGMFAGRLWESSEELKFNEDEILSIISNGFLLGTAPSSTVKRIGQMAALFCLRPSELRNVVKKFSILINLNPENLNPKITMFCAAFKEKAISQGYYREDREEVMKQLRGLVGKKGVSLDDMISIYRKHPVMKDLCEVMSTNNQVFAASLNSLEKAISYWSSVEYIGSLYAAYRIYLKRERQGKKDVEQEGE